MISCWSRTCTGRSRCGRPAPTIIIIITIIGSFISMCVCIYIYIYIYYAAGLHQLPGRPGEGGRQGRARRDRRGLHPGLAAVCVARDRDGDEGERGEDTEASADAAAQDGLREDEARDGGAREEAAARVDVRRGDARRRIRRRRAHCPRAERQPELHGGPAERQLLPHDVLLMRGQPEKGRMNRHRRRCHTTARQLTSGSSTIEASTNSSIVPPAARYSTVY